MRPRSYIKYTYWIEPEQRAGVEQALKAQGIRLKWARGVVCTPLDPLNKITLVPPQVWDETCHRQGSWYRTSLWAGRYLLVSSFPVSLPGCRPNTIIRPSGFNSPGPATPVQRQRLLASPVYRQRVPRQWHHMDQRERKRWKVWLSKMQIEEDLDLLLAVHSANHANFLEPLLYLEEKSGKVPYSIDRSQRLCSCCVEMYNVLGLQFPKKLVRPCLGALYFARLEADRFYEVLSGPGLHQQPMGP